MRIWAKRDIQRIGKLIIKVLAAFVEDCLSLRSKRVPQALQVACFFDTERLNFLRSEGFLVTFWPTKSNMSKNVNKNIIT